MTSGVQHELHIILWVVAGVHIADQLLVVCKYGKWWHTNMFNILAFGIDRVKWRSQHQ